MTRVLLIDDHERSRLDLAAILPQCGYEIAGEAESGKSAVVFVHTRNPDVVLVAGGSPGMDGIRTAQKIMHAKPLPIVFISSNYDPGAVERAKSAGVMGFITKPVRVEQLYPAIELAISCFQELAALRKENAQLKEALEARKVIERAKGVLMDQKRLSEERAYSLLKNTSMKIRKPMVDVARAVLVSAGLLIDKKK